MQALEFLEKLEPTGLVVICCGMTTKRWEGATAIEEFTWFHRHGSKSTVKSLPHALCCFVWHDPFLQCQLGERRGEIKLGIARVGNYDVIENVLELTLDDVKGILEWDKNRQDHWRGVCQRMGWAA